MSLDPYWGAQQQLQRDDGRPSPFGLLPAFFTAVGLDGFEYEHEADLDYRAPEGVEVSPPTLDDVLHGRPAGPRAPGAGAVLVSVSFLCPRCSMSLFVPTAAHPAPKTTPREVVVHWDRCIKSSTDGKWRPALTIVGPVACDYLTSEATGISGPTPTRCGWIGVVENGQCLDHSRVRGKIRAK